MTYFNSKPERLFLKEIRVKRKVVLTEEILTESLCFDTPRTYESISLAPKNRKNCRFGNGTNVADKTAYNN
jgi:hypothetical protein